MAVVAAALVAVACAVQDTLTPVLQVIAGTMATTMAGSMEAIIGNKVIIILAEVIGDITQVLVGVFGQLPMQ